MSGRLESYHDLLITASRKTGDVRDGIQGVVDTFESSADGLGEPWGSDSLGKQFAEGAQGYLASKKNIVDGAKNMAGTFANFSKSQHDSAVELEKKEKENADQFKGVAQA
ncbi:hypothetical protein GPX89_17250 [Nocardia sp. ET3-3]|uniref:WXG100 family type VII secretion target n=1 Tax=Nocardia terrae TaxID=2675851 RepID=A0A7K1UX77_9NOCA|nr:hypothetical protein [Nocardia terrae]MVU78986.1 hypothetical protein [Nocardia terrae]